MEVLESVEGSPHHSDMIPDCNGTEINLINCFSPNTPSITCDYLLVECRDPVTTEPTATTVTTATTDTESPTEGGSSGGVSVAVFAGLGGVIVVLIAVILIVTLLLVAILKKNKSRCMHGLNIFANT